MRKWYFQVFERNEEICLKTNIAEKYYKIGSQYTKMALIINHFDEIPPSENCIRSITHMTCAFRNQYISVPSLHIVEKFQHSSDNPIL